MKMNSKKDSVHIWNNRRGSANQYFICRGSRVLFGIPRFIGRIIAAIAPDVVDVEYL